jgi:hypothetical protein
MWSLSVLRAERPNLFLLSLAIPDVSGICPATATFSVFSVWSIGSFDKRQEFQGSKVLVIVGSLTPHIRHWLSDCWRCAERLVFQRGNKYPLASIFGGCWFCWLPYTFLSLENTLQPSLSGWLIQTCKIHLVGWVRFKLRASHPWALVHICQSRDLHLLLFAREGIN